MIHAPALVRRAAAGIALVALSLGTAYAQRPGASEYDVKAAYLYNFARFAEWPDGSPADAATSFSICVIGKDPFGAKLDNAIKGLEIRGARIVVRRLDAGAEARTCRVLFISGSQAAQLAQILGALEGASVLTVSDIPMFARRGGMIEFVSEGNRVRFEVHLPATRQAGLMLSSELLRVARAVITGDAP